MFSLTAQNTATALLAWILYPSPLSMGFPHYILPLDLRLLWDVDTEFLKMSIHMVFSGVTEAERAKAR
jgi:hypothetical protein